MLINYTNFATNLYDYREKHLSDCMGRLLKLSDPYIL